LNEEVPKVLEVPKVPKVLFFVFWLLYLSTEAYGEGGISGKQ